MQGLPVPEAPPDGFALHRVQGVQRRFYSLVKLRSVLIGISKLIELKNSKLLPEATYRISADGIMERSKYIFMDLKSGNVSNATVFLDIPTDDSDDIFKL